MPVHLALLSPRGENGIRRETATLKPNLETPKVAKEIEVIPMMETSKHAYKKAIKKDAAERIAQVCKSAVPMTEGEIIHLYKHALKHGTYEDAAVVGYNMACWTWANLEINEHEE